MAIKETITNILDYIKQGNVKYQIIGFLALIIYIILFYTFIDKAQIFRTYSIVTNSIFFVSIALSILFMVVKFDGNDILRNRFKSVMLNSTYFIIGLVVVYFAIQFISDSRYATDIASFIFQALSILGAVYLFYLIIHKTPLVQKLLKFRLFSLLYHALFLIPCYVFEGGVFVYENVKDTPTYVLKILGLQILFIAGWVIIPYIKERIFSYDGKVLLRNPIRTDKERVLGNNELLGKLDKNIELQNVDVSSSLNKDLSYKYGLSSWIFINNQGGNMSESSEVLTPLLRYGDKTAISYNSSTNTLQITSKKGMDGTEVIYSTTKIPLQRWNNIIMNYESGKVDVFLNGELVATKSDVVPYVTHDSITVGSENGVIGGIKNVLYYSEPLDKVKIDWIYKSQK
jgi:hypothetical protein